MIQDPDFDQSQRLNETSGDKRVRLARLRDTTGMRVRENDRGTVPEQCLLDHLARMNARPVYRASKEFDKLDEAMTIVEKQAAEGFVLPGTERHGQEVSCRSRRIEQCPLSEPVTHRLLGAIEDFIERGCPVTAGRLSIADAKK